MKVLPIVKIFGQLAVLVVLAMTGSVFAAVPQDYDGDGKTDLAVVRRNPDQSITNYILQSRDGFTTTQWDLTCDSTQLVLRSFLPSVGF